MESNTSSRVLPKWGELNPVKTTTKKPCCVCKTTKHWRDICIRKFDEDNDVCLEFAKAHKLCQRAKGFNVAM